MREGQRGILACVSHKISPSLIAHDYRGEDPVWWVYFGHDYSSMRKWEDGLPAHFRRISVSRSFDEVSAILRPKFTEYINTINRHNSGSFEWWFTAASSRNIFASSLFENICIFAITDSLWDDVPCRPSFIVVESPLLGKGLVRWAERREISCVHIQKSSLSSFYNGLRKFHSAVGSLIYLLCNHISALLSRLLVEYDSFSDVNTLKTTVLLSTFVHHYSLSPEGDFHDRYFPFLHEYIHSEGGSVLVHPNFPGKKFNRIGMYRKLRSGKTHFLIPADYLTIRDYFSAFLQAIKTMGILPDTLSFGKYDISDLVGTEENWALFPEVLESLCLYRYILSLGRSGITPECILLWHENQLRDKALIRAGRDAFSGTPITGAQLYVHYPNYLSLFPIESEAEASFVPDLLLETGPEQCRDVRRFLSSVPCKPAASLRYSYIFENSLVNVPADDRILLLLPSDLPGAMEILVRVTEVGRKMVHCPPIHIKCHPDYSEDVFRRKLPDDMKDGFDALTFIDDPAPDPLRNSRIVISSSSGSIVEAVALGKPVLILARFASLNLNPFEGYPTPMCRVCYSNEELAEGIEHYLALDPNEVVKSGKESERVRDDYFTPVNKSTLSRFLAKVTEKKNSECLNGSDQE